MSTSSQASSASARVRATTAQTASPAQHARSIAMACCGADLMPFEMGEHADPRRDHLGEFCAGDDRDHARRLLRRRGVDRHDPGVGVWRAHEGGMRHARQRHVADILGAALCQPAKIGSAAPNGRYRNSAGRGRRERAASPRRFSCFASQQLTRGVTRARAHKNRVGHIIVRHMCDDGVLSQPSPSFGCLKLRPMMSTKSSRSTLASGSNE